MSSEFFFSLPLDLIYKFSQLTFIYAYIYMYKYIHTYNTPLDKNIRPLWKMKKKILFIIFKLWKLDIGKISLRDINLWSQREILKALWCSKTIIYNYLKSPDKYGRRKPTRRPEKLSPQFKRKIVCEVKKKLCHHQKYWNLLWMLFAVLEQLEDIYTTKKLKHKKEFIVQV